MIDVLINNHWTKMTQEELQIGSKYFAFESGLYETMRTMNYKLVFLEPHLERLFSTAQKINLKIHHSLEEITEMLEKVINNFPDPNQRIRILSVPDKFIIYTSPLNLNPIIYDGVNALTVEAQRDTKQPIIKSVYQPSIKQLKPTLLMQFCVIKKGIFMKEVKAIYSG